MNQKPLSPEEELRRSGEAKRLLESDIFQEACAYIEDGLAEQRRRVPMRESEMHTRLILAEQLWVQLKDYIQQVADTGLFAQYEIKQQEQRKSIIERMLSGSLRE